MKKVSLSKKSAVDVFVSHSCIDENRAKILIELVRLALNIPANKIRCKSVHGYKLTGGTTPDEQLRADIAASKVFICIITPSSVKSTYVTFEIGARWGTNQLLIPLISSRSGTRLLKGPLRNIHSLNCSRKEEIFQLINELAKYLSIEPELPAVYTGKVEELAKLSIM